MSNSYSNPFRFGDTSISKELISLHLKELGQEDRKLRFFSPVSDRFIDEYVSSSTRDDSFWVVICDLETLAVVAALHVALSPDGRTAELGFSVLPEFRGNDLATKLMEAAILILRTTKCNNIILNCLSSNKAVQKICENLGLAVTTVAYDEKEGRMVIDAPLSTFDIHRLSGIVTNSGYFPNLLTIKRFVTNLFPWMKR